MIPKVDDKQVEAVARVLTMAFLAICLLLTLVGVYIFEGVSSCQRGVVKKETKWETWFGRTVDVDVSVKACTNPDFANGVSLLDTFK